MSGRLSDLKNKWKQQVTEAAEMTGAGNSGREEDYKGSFHDEDGGSGKAYGGETVKGVDSQGKEDGVGNSAPMDFTPSNGENDLSGNTKSVDREAGASAGRKESGDGDETGSDKEVDGANPVPRPEGAEGAPKTWDGMVGDFKVRVRNTLGLGGDVADGEDKINKNNEVNKGLNQDGRDDDIKKNLG